MDGTALPVGGAVELSWDAPARDRATELASTATGDQFADTSRPSEDTRVEFEGATGEERSVSGVPKESAKNDMDMEPVRQRSISSASRNAIDATKASASTSKRTL